VTFPTFWWTRAQLTMSQDAVAARSIARARACQRELPEPGYDDELYARRWRKPHGLGGGLGCCHGRLAREIEMEWADEMALGSRISVRAGIRVRRSR